MAFQRSQRQCDDIMTWGGDKTCRSLNYPPFKYLPHSFWKRKNNNLNGPTTSLFWTAEWEMLLWEPMVLPGDMDISHWVHGWFLKVQSWTLPAASWWSHQHPKGPMMPQRFHQLPEGPRGNVMTSLDGATTRPVGSKPKLQWWITGLYF